jgi:phage tail-like protein
MAVNDRLDPFRTFNFRLEIEGITVAAFSEVSGLSSDGDAVDYRTGMDIPLTARKLIGLRKYSPIVLKRGMVKDTTLWDWYGRISVGQNDRKSGTVVLMDEARNDVLRWHFDAAWPNKMEGPSMKASGNDVAIESIELVHEGLELEVA